MTDPFEDVDEVPVLLAGGGLVGLSTAMFLAQHGVASLAVEPLRGGSPLPRAAFFHMRTLELFRAAGIEDEVRRQSLKEFEPEGAIVMVQTLAGGEVASIIPSLNEGVDALSPCRRLFVTQPGLEPILRARAERAGARVLEGTAVVGLAQDADGVVATVRDVETGRQQHVDPVPQRGYDQAVGERVVGLPVGPQQELALRAPAGDQVELAGQNRTRRHAGLAIKILASQQRRDLAQLELGVAGCRPSMSESRTRRGQDRVSPRWERQKLPPVGSRPEPARPR